MSKRKNTQPSIQPLLNIIKESLAAMVPESEIFVYGSVARGTNTPESDIDILLITPTQLSWQEKDKIYDVIFELNLKWDVIISVVIISKSDWIAPIRQVTPFYKNVISEYLPL